MFEGKREGATGRKGRPDSGGAPARHVKRGAPQGWTVFRMPTGWTVFETPSTPWLPDIRPIRILRLRLEKRRRSVFSRQALARGAEAREGAKEKEGRC